MGLKLIVKLGYGVGHVTNDLCSALWFTYVLIFYELVLGFTKIYSGLVLLVGQIADAVATPIIGVLCDRGPTIWKIDLRKRKLWYFTGTIIVLITFPFLFFECIGCEQASMSTRFAYYIVFVITHQIAWAGVQIAHLAIAPDLTFEEQERTTLMSLRNTFTVLSSLFIYLLAFLLFQIYNKGDKTGKLNPEDLVKFEIIVITSMALGSIASLFCYLTVTENRERLAQRVSKKAQRDSYKKMFCSIGCYQLTLIYMSARIFCNVSQALLPLYLNVTLQLDKPTIASMPFVMFASSFIASLASAPLNDSIGRKLTFLVGAFLSFSASLWIRVDTSSLYKHYFIYIVIILLGFASSLLLVTALAVTADYIGDDISNSAFLYGILSFVDKMTCGVVIMVIQALEAHFGSMYYRDVLAYVCSGSAAIGTLCVITLKKTRKIPEDQEASDEQQESRRSIRSSIVRATSSMGPRTLRDFR